jgi:hypothetical protein
VHDQRVQIVGEAARTLIRTDEAGGVSVCGLSGDDATRRLFGSVIATPFRSTR